ncbi:hypothetical protein PHMEG_00010242 [Phytophthora megakarya]|uniref:Uncharacterized protein n=1 Tax=Phytophthora megakarya TaxID=4795 RepID=A0A225WER3_9STRA|nr:hypothetical protein PHMEG_00010242 [Phytophthora megakarya]
MKYTEWQVLAYAESLNHQPSNGRTGDNNLNGDRSDAQRSNVKESADIWIANTGVTVRTPDDDSSCSEDSSDDLKEGSSSEVTPKLDFGSSITALENSFISVVKAITTKGYESAEDDVVYVHEPADVDLTDYAQELAFLPDLSDHSPT